MAVIKLRNGTIIGDYCPPYIVAEVNSSHNGDLLVAKSMIDAARDAGCDCVKFQSWSEKSLYSQSYYEQNPVAQRILKKFSLSPGELEEVCGYCAAKKIDFCSTPYSKEEVDFLVDVCKSPFIKVASMDLVTHDYLEYIGYKGIPIVLSTGMGTMDEIRSAVHVVESTGNKNLCLLHCISIYPPDPSTINLNNIWALREIFPSYPIGFSDHSSGVEISTGAAALGVSLIEKHLTLDKNKIGLDNQMALEPSEFSLLVRSVKCVNMALGSRERVLAPDELKQRLKMRRSIIATRDMPAGTVLTKADLGAKRPGTGIPPEKLSSLIGKILSRDVCNDMLLQEDDFF